MIIDFHTHIYPDTIAEKAVANIGAFYGMQLQCTGTAEQLLDIGRRSGIDKFVVLGAAQTATQVAKINTYIADVCAAHPATFIGFAALHPDIPDAEQEIERIIAAGFKGIKLHPDMQHVNIDSPAMMTLYARLEGRLPVIFHTGDYRSDYSHPRRLARVIDTFPRLCVIAAHLGGWSIFDLALEHLRDRPCYFDLSSAIDFIGPRRMEELINQYGAHRILFASDYPMYNPARELEKFNTLKLPGATRTAILYQNAATLLKLES